MIYQVAYLENRTLWWVTTRHWTSAVSILTDASLTIEIILLVIFVPSGTLGFWFKRRDLQIFARLAGFAGIEVQGSVPGYGRKTSTPLSSMFPVQLKWNRCLVVLSGLRLTVLSRLDFRLPRWSSLLHVWVPLFTSYTRKIYQSYPLCCLSYPQVFATSDEDTDGLLRSPIESSPSDFCYQ